MMIGIKHSLILETNKVTILNEDWNDSSILYTFCSKTKVWAMQRYPNRYVTGIRKANTRKHKWWLYEIQNTKVQITSIYDYEFIDWKIYEKTNVRPSRRRNLS